MKKIEKLKTDAFESLPTSQLEHKINELVSVVNILAERECVGVPRELIEEVCKYCEDKAISDKLSKYNDFYYKLKKLL